MSTEYMNLQRMLSLIGERIPSQASPQNLKKRIVAREIGCWDAVFSLVRAVEVVMAPPWGHEP